MIDELSKSKEPQAQQLNQGAVILSISLFVLLILGMFVFAYLKQQEIVEEPLVAEPDAKSEQDDGRYSSITRIDGKHFYIDGVHTVVGEINMPTPCDLLEGKLEVAESYPEQIFLDFTVTNNAEFCAEVVTPQRFKLSASASPAATFSARFDDRRVELNLVEAEPGETPDDFELYIKG